MRAGYLAKIPRARAALSSIRLVRYVAIALLSYDRVHAGAVLHRDDDCTKASRRNSTRLMIR